MPARSRTTCRPLRVMRCESERRGTDRRGHQAAPQTRRFATQQVRVPRRWRRPMSHSARMLAAPAVAAVVIAAAAPAAQAQSPTTRASVQCLVTAGAPGAILLTDRRGHRAGVAAGRDLRAGASFRIGSLTKTYVAAVVLQLADEGRLSLDDPVARYLPRVVPG